MYNSPWAAHSKTMPAQSQQQTTVYEITKYNLFQMATGQV